MALVLQPTDICTYLSITNAEPLVLVKIFEIHIYVRKMECNRMDTTVHDPFSASCVIPVRYPFKAHSIVV